MWQGTSGVGSVYTSTFFLCDSGRGGWGGGQREKKGPAWRVRGADPARADHSVGHAREKS